MAFPRGTPRASRIVGARSVRPCAELTVGPVHEEDPGNELRIDDMIAAPLPGIILEMALRDTPQRRAPRGPVAPREVHEQVGCFLDERTGVYRLSGSHAADGDHATCRVDQTGQPPGDGRLELLGRLSLDRALRLAALQVEIDPAQPKGVGAVLDQSTSSRRSRQE